MELASSWLCCKRCLLQDVGKARLCYVGLCSWQEEGKAVMRSWGECQSLVQGKGFCLWSCGCHCLLLTGRMQGGVVRQLAVFSWQKKGSGVVGLWLLPMTWDGAVVSWTEETKKMARQDELELFHGRVLRCQTRLRLKNWVKVFFVSSYLWQGFWLCVWIAKSWPTSEVCVKWSWLCRLLVFFVAEKMQLGLCRS